MKQITGYKVVKMERKLGLDGIMEQYYTAHILRHSESVFSSNHFY